MRVCGNGVKPAAGLEPRKPDRLTSHLVGRRADDGVGAVVPSTVSFGGPADRESREAEAFDGLRE